MHNNRGFTVRNIAMISVMAAFFFAASWIKFTIPTPVDNTRLHLGNVMCLLAGLLLGPVPGGLAAGFGSMFYDLTAPLFIAPAPFPFVFKFAMAWLCGKIARTGGAGARHHGRNLAAATAGALLYVLLYLGKGFCENYFFLRMELTPVLISVGQKAVVSVINGILAVVIAVPLSAALRAALPRANLMSPHEE